MLHKQLTGKMSLFWRAEKSSCLGGFWGFKTPQTSTRTPWTKNTESEEQGNGVIGYIMPQDERK